MADNCIQVDNEQELNRILMAGERVIALIYATWCPFCIMFLPVFRRYAQGKPNFVLVRDDQEIFADQYQVDVVPTILFFENGKVTKRLDGILGIGLNERQLTAFIESVFM
jgi:thiol-disulfide isomerase/thioredoxin